MKFELFAHQVEAVLNELHQHIQPHCKLTLLMRNPQSDDGDAIWTTDDMQAVEDSIRRFKEKEAANV